MITLSTGKSHLARKPQNSFKGYFSARVFNLDIRFGISRSQTLMKNKILALYFTGGGREIVDLLGNKTF
jgi:hypothetical protein